MEPDGPEQREADRIEREYERDLRDCDVDMEQEIDASYARDDIGIPIACIVHGHIWFTNRFKLTFCQRCGQDKDDEVTA